MNVTPIGYLVFASLVFGVILMMCVARRWKINGTPKGVFANLYFGAILVIISHLFIMGSALSLKAGYDMATFPHYDATIISFESQWEEVERTDSDGDSYTTDVLMHTSKLQFRDETGRVIIHDGNIRSGAEPVVGSTQRIAYKDEKLYIVSVASIGLLIGVGFIMQIFGFILVKVISFAIGRSPKWVDIYGSFVFAMVIYGGMLGMLAAMIYGVSKYFQPGSDMPFWAMIMCAFFSLVLTLALAGIVFGLKADAEDNSA